MTLYSRITSTPVSQTEKADPRQQKNNAGGVTFTLDCWKRLDRFLVLGSEVGTYYANERDHTKQAVTCIDECIAQDGARTVRRIVEISDAGRAPKNDPAIFALACCASAKDPATRTAALNALPQVCRIGTHLFHFVADVNAQRKWSRQLRTAVAKWYTEKTADKLAYQLAKYQQRDGWSHRDVLRLAHPKSPTPAHDAAFRWATAGFDAVGKESKAHKVREVAYASAKELPAILQAMQEIHSIAKNSVDGSRFSAAQYKKACELIREYRLPHECVPTEMKNSPEVWEALFDCGMGMTALLRNLNKMTSIGLIKPLTNFTNRVIDQLTDQQQINKSRLHPLQVLLGLTTYNAGRGVKGDLTWTPVPSISSALDNAFYKAFDAVEPTGKNIMLALDVSGSMGSPFGGTHLTCSQATAAMSMVTARTEKNYYIHGFAHTFRDLGITAADSLNTAVKKVYDQTFGRTDCSLPMLYAQRNKLEVDAFCVYSDNETYAGSVHPHVALEKYRQSSGRNAKLIVVGFTSTGFTIANPSDAGMLDMVGFDASAPALISDFIAEREAAQI